MSTGKILKEARLKKGISQRKLAEITGVTQISISQIETGKVNPSMTTLKKLFGGLDLELVIREK